MAKLNAEEKLELQMLQFQGVVDKLDKVEDDQRDHYEQQLVGLRKSMDKLEAEISA